MDETNTKKAKQVSKNKNNGVSIRVLYQKSLVIEITFCSN